MKSVSTKTYPLDAVGVNALIEALTAFFGEQRLDRRTVVRARLVAEELLLCVMAHEEAPETCTLTVGTCFGGAFAEICYGGAPIDPTASADEWSARLLANLRLTPVWSFRAGANTLRLRVRRPSGRKDLLRLAAAAVAAGVLGALGGVLPAAVVSGISELLLLPLFNAFVGLIVTLAGPLILFTVASGVFRIGDTKLLQKAGKLMFSRYLLVTLACSLFSTLAASRVFPLTAAPSSGEAQLSAISQLLFDILPSNPVAPFLNANMMQIVVLSIFLGVVLLLLGERAGTVACFVEESAWVLQAMMEQVCRLIPLFVFAALLRMIWSGAAARLLDFWKPFALFLALLACAFAAALVTTALRTKTPVLLLLRKLLPQITVAFTTASSMAAFETSIASCEKQMGVDKHFATFGAPIGSVVFMPSSALAIVLLSIYLAHFYGVPADLRWYVQACLLAAVLSIAAPPTPGAALTVNTVMLARLGIPAEGLLLFATVGVLLDFFDTAGNVAMRDLELVRQADLLGLLDRETLHRQ